MVETKNQLLATEYRVNDPAAQAVWAIKQATGCDGYEMIDVAGQLGWYAQPSWGEDGWNLGEWPYVIIFTRQTAAGCFQVAYYVEGDVTIYEYLTLEQHNAAIDALAFFHWKARSESWISGLADADAMPARLCGPFSAKRLRQQKER